MTEDKTILGSYTPSNSETDEQNNGVTLVVEEEPVDTRCGCTASCKPSWLQRFANPKAYLVVISLCTIMQGFAVNGINNVNIGAYERRYLLTSRDSSLVASFYDVAAGISVLFVGYFGATAHQPRILGFGVLSIGLGTLVMSLAHFTAPTYEPQAVQVLTCNASSASTCDSSEGQAFLKNYLYILLLGQSLNGFGGTCLYSIGVTYLDESVSAKMSPLYIGLMAGSSIFGPAIGYILGGYLLELYVHPSMTPPAGLTSSSPAWVGAWWLGFVISSIFSFILATFMFLFPKELPDTKAIRAQKVSEANNDGSEDKVNKVGFGLTWRDMPKATWYLLKNLPYMCLTAVVALELILAAGMSTFLPKYLSNQFSQTASWAGMLTGFMAVPGAALGQVAGGYVCKKLKLKMRGIMKLTIICSVLALLATPVMWARCSGVKLAGVLTKYPESGGPEELSTPNLASTCNEGCGCTTSFYDPVCAGGVQYFSACHAGCITEPYTNSEGKKIYSNCNCPANTSGMANMSEVELGHCDVDCNLLYYVFIPFGFLMFFFTFMMGSPLTVATLRVVPEKQRAFGVSVQWVFLRFLGSIPGPIIFGSMIDASCSLWKEDCDVKGSCWIYNGFEMSKRLFILVVVLKVISIIFNVLALVLYKPPAEKVAQELNELNSSKNGINGHSVHTSESDK